MEEEQTLVLKFDGASTAQANQFAETLSRELKQSVPDVNVRRKRENEETQDFGTTLVLVLGTPAAIALAKALQSWAARYGTSVSVSDENGTVLLKNVQGSDAAKIVAAIEGARK
jgi:hypothetical protein